MLLRPIPQLVHCSSSFFIYLKNRFSNTLSSLLHFYQRLFTFFCVIPSRVQPYCPLLHLKTKQSKANVSWLLSSFSYYLIFLLLSIANSSKALSVHALSNLTPVWSLCLFLSLCPLSLSFSLSFYQIYWDPIYIPGNSPILSVQVNEFSYI